MVLLIWLLTATGCDLNMRDQTRVEPFEASPFFAENQSARAWPAYTIPHGYPASPTGFTTGQSTAGELVTTLPISATAAVIERGQSQYAIFCSPCHGQSGDGDGLIVQHGFPAPPSFHSDRLRQVPVGHHFQIISHGLGKMYPYADRITPEDRWAIIAYIQAEIQANDIATGTPP
jgi:mono/diheme cytochrome c family protein